MALGRVVRAGGRAAVRGGFAAPARASPAGLWGRVRRGPRWPAVRVFEDVSAASGRRWASAEAGAGKSAGRADVKTRLRAQKASETPSSGGIVPRSPLGLAVAAVLGLGVCGGGFYVWKMQQEGVSLTDMLDMASESLKKLGSGHSDPDRMAFSPQLLRTYPLDASFQDGVRGEPIVTLVLQMEGTLLEKEYDRKSGMRHRKRPGLNHFFDELTKVSPGRLETWLWSSDSQTSATMVVNHLLTKEGVGLGLDKIQSLSPVLLSKEHLYSEDGHLVKRLQPLPRHLPSVILIDSDVRSYRSNPNNTILIPPIPPADALPEGTDPNAYQDPDMDVVADFIRLFRQLHRAKKARTPSDVLIWLRHQHPEIDMDPARNMAIAIRKETEEVRENAEKIEKESLGAALRRVQGDTVIGKGRAVTAGSTRYQKVHSNSILDATIQRMKADRERRIKAMQDAAE